MAVLYWRSYFDKTTLFLLRVGIYCFIEIKMQTNALVNVILWYYPYLRRENYIRKLHLIKYYMINILDNFNQFPWHINLLSLKIDNLSEPAQISNSLLLFTVSRFLTPIHLTPII